MQNNPAHTAAENHANSAPVPAFTTITNDYWRKQKVREANARYWLHVLFQAEKEQDFDRIRRATDAMAEYVMQARADAEARAGEVWA